MYQALLKALRTEEQNTVLALIKCGRHENVSCTSSTTVA